MNTAVIAYIPPDRLNSVAFLRNLRNFRTESQVIFYSDDKSHGVIKIPDPALIKKSKNRVAIQNLVFLAGLKIAQEAGVKRFLYLEADCRVGCDNWDKIMFDEAAQYPDAFAAGTPAIYNRTAMSGIQKAYTDEYCGRFRSQTGWDVPVFQARTQRPLGCVFLMGAGCIFNTAVAADLFMGFEQDSIKKAERTPAFDLLIGMRCVQLFRHRSTSKLPFLTRSFSTYGNKQTTEKERIEMLKSGKAVLCHQIKSNTDCLD